MEDDVMTTLIYNEMPPENETSVFGITKHSSRCNRLGDRQYFVDRYYSDEYFAGVFLHRLTRTLTECFAVEYAGPYYEWAGFLNAIKDRHW